MSDLIKKALDGIAAPTEPFVMPNGIRDPGAALPRLDPAEANEVRRLIELQARGLADAARKGITGFAAFAHAYEWMNKAEGT